MAGYQVDVADDGEAGLIVAAARTPAAATIDLGVAIHRRRLLAESLGYVFGEHIRLIAPDESQDEPEGARAEPSRRIRSYAPGEAGVAQPGAADLEATARLLRRQGAVRHVNSSPPPPKKRASESAHSVAAPRSATWACPAQTAQRSGAYRCRECAASSCCSP